MTSSARMSSVAGIVRLSALAVLTDVTSRLDDSRKQTTSQKVDLTAE